MIGRIPFLLLDKRLYPRLQLSQGSKFRKWIVVPRRAHQRRRGKSIRAASGVLKKVAGPNVFPDHVMMAKEKLLPVRFQFLARLDVNNLDLR